jgi:hypothetical protein
MSDTTTPIEAPAPRDDTTDPQGEQGHGRRRDPVADAARYRHRLRETEAERDQIAEVARTAQTTMVEQAVTALRSKGQALTHSDDLARFTGKTLTDYVEDGIIDQDALQADIDQLHADRPELFHTIRYAPRPDKSQGSGGDCSAGGQRWSDAFRTRR